MPLARRGGRKIPDAGIPSQRATVDEYTAGTFHTTVHNGHRLGYVIPNSATTMSAPLTSRNVSLAHATRARLVFNGCYQGYGTDGIRLGTGRLRYQIINGPIHVRAFMPGEGAMLDMPGQTGGYNHAIEVPLAELVDGENAVRFSTLNIESEYPNAVLNLDLVLDGDADFLFADGFEQVHRRNRHSAQAAN